MVTLIDREFTVNVPRERAWEYLARLDLWPTWAPHIRHIATQPQSELGPNSSGVIMELELIAITEDGRLEKPVESVPTLAAQVIEATTQLYKTAGYQPPWVGYLAVENGSVIGSCGFKSPPENNRVEIAYFTFPGHESRGLATRMASALVRIAINKMPALIVAAQTLPEESASTSVLKKLQFRFVGSVEHPEDGLVWEWQLGNTSQA